MVIEVELHTSELTGAFAKATACDHTAIRLDPKSFPHPPLNGNNHFPPTIENVGHLLRETGVSAQFNVIKKRLELRNEHEAPVSMNRVTSSALLNGMGTGWLYPFVEELAAQSPTNPIKDWILSEPWDGQDRLEALFETVRTIDDYPGDLKSILLLRWLMSATAAAVNDGAVTTHGVLTLQGPQGVGKTSWINRLLPANLRADYIKLDHHLDGSNKDSILGCVTHFIVEIGELESSFRKDIARLKGFLTNDCDKLRRPYGRDEVEYPRKTVFAATVNDDRFLIDITGNRRWWTIAISELEYRHSVDMQQVFAQLAEKLTSGEQWWLTPTEAKKLAEYNIRHLYVSAMKERILDYIEPALIGQAGGTAKTASEVLRELGVRNPSNVQCKECGSVLRELYGAPKRIQGREKWRVHVRAGYDPTSPSVAPPLEF